MPFKSDLKLNAKIFDPKERRRAFSNVPMRSARNLRESMRRKMIESKPAGRIEIYEGDRSQGRGFSRRFRRSRRGQRPAIETTTLLNAIDARRTGEFSAIVDIKDRKNPKNGESAKEYAERLQNDLGREVMTDRDVAEADRDFANRGASAVKGLLA